MFDIIKYFITVMFLIIFSAANVFAEVEDGGKD